MNKVDEIAEKIAQAIEKANSSYIYSSQCFCILKLLCELRDLITDFPNQSNIDELDSILTQLNKLCELLDSFKSTSWADTSLQTPVDTVISNLNEIMTLLQKSVETLNITITNKYTISIDNITDDLNSIYGKLYDPVKLEIPAVKNKLNEIDQYLTKIGRPLLNKTQKKKDKTKHDIIDFDSDSSSTSYESESDEDYDKSKDSEFSEKYTNFNDLQKYLIKKTDYTQDPHPFARSSLYSLYNGKMKLSQEKVTIMVLDLKKYPIEKFKRLINVLTAVKHPNLDSFVGAVDSPLPFVVVTRRNGQKLSDILKKDDDQNAIKPGFRTKIAYQIASAMAYLHSINITHRDLCTKNIMIDKELNPRITNLATARIIPENRLTMSVRPSCSTEFRAPEICEFEGYSKEVDVFSFSEILYQLLTNKRPFFDREKKDIESLIHLAKRPELPESTPPELRDLINSCWQQEPGKRPSFIDIIQTMLTKSIIFPQDKESDVVNDFYGPKKIENNDFKKCFELFNEIQLEITNCYAYKQEATRIRTFIYGYQNKFQSHEDANKHEIINDNVNLQISNLRDSLEGLRSTLKQTEIEVWSRNALLLPVLEIPNALHQYMKQIFISLSSIGLNVNKYDFNDHDLIWDLRFLYNIFVNYQDKFKKAVDRIDEIFSFMDEKDFDLSVSETEVDEIVKSVLSNWKDYEVNRSDFNKSEFCEGKGGSCKVFKGTQISTNKKVAIKVMKSNVFDDENGLKLLRREIGNLVQLKNEYLVKFIGFCPENPFWIITEFIEGGNLSNAIHKLSPLLKTKVAFEIAQGMEYLGSKRIIHRDLKSDNILIDGDLKKTATPKICDFGLARADLSILMSNRAGTVQYMAPEVINGKNYNLKADVFSFGMILWEMRSRKRPFHQFRSRDEVFEKILKKEPLPFDKEISEDLKELIQNATNFDPLQRPTFNEIIYRMMNKKISFFDKNDTDVDEINKFYEQKGNERNPQ